MIKEKLLTKKIYGRLTKHGLGRIVGSYVYEYKRYSNHKYLHTAAGNLMEIHIYVDHSLKVIKTFVS